MPAPPPYHPLRRVSTGSLSGLARSQDRPQSATSGLEFLHAALTDMADEAATLSTNLERLNGVYDALGKFNEGFAAYLYALKMNAFCIDWSNMPDANSYARLPELMAAEPEPEPEPESPRAQTPPPGDAGDTSLPPSPDTHPGDQTYATVYSATPPKPRGRPGIRPPVARAGATARPASTAGAGARPGSSASRPGSRPASAAGGVLRKPSTGTGIRRPAAGAAAAKAPVKKISAAAKKKRSLMVARIIDSQLPLEYRGRDPDARLGMETVIDKLLDAEQDSGLAIADFTSPTMPHPRVNKCLISLVAKKLVAKGMEDGRTMYHWVGEA